MGSLDITTEAIACPAATRFQDVTRYPGARATQLHPLRRAVAFTLPGMPRTLGGGRLIGRC